MNEESLKDRIITKSINNKVSTLKRLIFVTGPPGVGKTSVLLRSVNGLKNRGYKIGGMISREVREGGVRVGFEIMDFSTGQRGWLAHINQPTGPKISKYRVNLTDLEAIGVSSILDAIRSADMIIVDEIGPMELFSSAFRDAVIQAAESDKPVLGTIHFGLRNSLVNSLKKREDAEIFEVTYENRETLHNFIIDKVVQSLQKLS
ncbi:MAG: NTPase [Candidatus Bathyarchaeota archaeon]|nr:NTPase [Candidatus Bathyarchaeota archaeon]MDH5419087.1 NTPase [Candidatus Bathyarchaeota archaeon]MDH5635252.1 NTPase [Candidatus Bathyarchaeota archaeon]MDH5701467.1 NTPase [Candidatus Bathyarchaeota archaeon]